MPYGLYSPWNSPGQNTGVGSLSLLQGIFPTQRLNPGLLHCRWILYQLSHKGNPRILEWVAYSFSRGSSLPRNRTGVSFALQVDSLPTELSGKPKTYLQGMKLGNNFACSFVCCILAKCQFCLFVFSFTISLPITGKFPSKGIIKLSFRLFLNDCFPLC